MYRVPRRSNGTSLARQLDVHTLVEPHSATLFSLHADSLISPSASRGVDHITSARQLQRHILWFPYIWCSQTLNLTHTGVFARGQAWPTRTRGTTGYRLWNIRSSADLLAAIKQAYFPKLTKRSETKKKKEKENTKNRKRKKTPSLNLVSFSSLFLCYFPII